MEIQRQHDTRRMCLPWDRDGPLLVRACSRRPPGLVASDLLHLFQCTILSPRYDRTVHHLSLCINNNRWKLINFIQVGYAAAVARRRQLSILYHTCHNGGSAGSPILQTSTTKKTNKQYGPTLLATNLHQYFTVIMYLRRLIQVHFDNNSSIHVSQSDRNALQWRTTKTQSLKIKRNKFLETQAKGYKTLIIQPGNQRNYTECATKMSSTKTQNIRHEVSVCRK